MNDRNPTRARRLACGLALAAALAVLPTAARHALAARAIVTAARNQVSWSGDGAIDATLYETEVIGGVNGNFWPDLKVYRRIGQTFRCAGPRLAAVQVGLDNVDTGYRGLTYRHRGAAISIRLRRGGPEGPIVARRQFAPKAVRSDLLLAVDLPSDASMTWTVEVAPDHLEFPDGKIFLNATRQDTYPAGRLLLNGKPAESDTSGHPAAGDLHIRVTRSWRAQARRAGKAVFWAARPEERIWMDPTRTMDLMLADDPARPVRLAAAGNERVSHQFIVTPAPTARIGRAELSVGPVKGPGGAAIDPKSIRVEWLRYSLDYNRGRTSRRLYPDPLAPTAAAEGVPGEPDMPINRAFWMSIRVPAGTAAGVYRMTATVRINNELTLTRPIELEVFGFDLPRRTHTRTGLFRQNGGNLARHLWWASDLAEFRIALGDPFWTDLNSRQRSSKFSEESYQFILGPQMQQSLVAFGKHMSGLGLHVTNVTPWGDTHRMFRGQKGGREGIIRFWKTYYPILKTNGWVEEAYCRMPDELKGEQLPKVRRIVDLFRKHAPGVRVLVTSMGTPEVKDLQNGIGIADIWCPDTRYVPPAMAFWKKRMAAGEEVWPYIHEFTWHGSDLPAARLFFWMLERHGFQGTCYFAIKRARFKPAWHGVIRHTDTWPGDGDLYYDPGSPEANVRGLWRSTRLYRIGDGIEDREYFRMMNRLAARARATGKLSDPAAREVAALNAALDEVVWGMVSFTHDMAKVERIRRRVASVILELQKQID